MHLLSFQTILQGPDKELPFLSSCLSSFMINIVSPSYETVWAIVPTNGTHLALCHCIQNQLLFNEPMFIACLSNVIVINNEELLLLFFQSLLLLHSQLQTKDFVQINTQEIFDNSLRSVMGPCSHHDFIWVISIQILRRLTEFLSEPNSIIYLLPWLLLLLLLCVCTYEF